jgi:hypothetical protein
MNETKNKYQFSSELSENSGKEIDLKSEDLEITLNLDKDDNNGIEESEDFDNDSIEDEFDEYFKNKSKNLNLG